MIMLYCAMIMLVILDLPLIVCEMFNM